jgi:hypothetical protein
MNKIISLVKKDWKNSLNDKMTIFVLFFPIIISIVVRIFLPSFENASIKIFIDTSVPNNKVVMLENYFEIEKLENYNSLENKVNSYGDNLGVIFSENSLKLVLTGSESPHIINVVKSVLNYVNQDKSLNYEIESLGIRRSVISDVLNTGVLILIVGMVGFSMGFTIVEDKESKMFSAMGVSPIILSDYLISKIITVLIQSALFALIAQLILIGLNFNLFSFFIIFISGSMMGIFLGFVIGIFSDNQNAAIAVSKVTIFICCMLPMISFLVPEQFQKLFYVIPGYWVMKVFSISILNIEGNLILTLFIALIIHLLFIIALTPKMKKTFKIGRL